MRHTPHLVLLCLFLFFSSDDAHDATGPVPDCPGDVPQDQPCLDRGEISLEPVSIEDRSYERRLESQAAWLIEHDRTVDMRTLLSQLEREQCELDLPGPQLFTRSPAELFHDTKESVVVIAGLYKCRRCTEWHTTTASGFVITSTGAIVTNYHVVNNDNVVAMVAMMANRRVLPVREVLAANAADDLAILRVDADDLRPLPIADSFNAAPVGSSVGVVSHPDGRFYCYTSGVVSRYMKIRSEGQLVDAVSITADYARGSSGAPVLNPMGQVVGVVMSTESVYYTETADQQLNLQMVFKTCVPSKNIHRLVRPTTLLNTAANRP